MKRLGFAGALLAMGAFGSAHAADVVYADTTQPFSQEQIASAIDVAFGVTATTAYVSRGVDWSGGPALQGYVELSYDWVYVGVWASTIGGPNQVAGDRVEVNYYGGIRPTFGDLSLDIGYARYWNYSTTGDLGGEIYGKAEYEIGSIGLTPGVELYWDPQNATTYGVAKASLALPHDFTLSGGVGTDFEGAVDWNGGVSYTFNDMITLDGRYHGSNLVTPGSFRHKFVASISFDTTWSALRGR